MLTLLKEPIEAFTFIRRQQGWRTAFNQVGQFLKEPFFELHRGYVLRKSLLDPIDISPPQVAVTIKPVTLNDLVLLETIIPPLRVKRLAHKMRAGELGCVAIEEQKAIAYVFAGFTHTPSTRAAQLTLGPREAYLWSGYALPQYRRQGVVRAVNLNLCQLLQKKGYESAILLVERQNEASLGHCAKMGYVVTDQIDYLRILSWGLSRLVPLQVSK